MTTSEKPAEQQPMEDFDFYYDDDYSCTHWRHIPPFSAEASQGSKT